jgi:hypothetical protein
MKLTNTFKRESIDAIAELAAEGIYEAASAISCLYDSLKNNMDDSQRRNASLSAAGITAALSDSIDILRVLIDNGHWVSGVFHHEHLDHINRQQHAAWQGIMEWHRNQDDGRALPSYLLFSDLFRTCADLRDMVKGERPGGYWAEDGFEHWRHLARRMAAQFPEVAS